MVIMIDTGAMLLERPQLCRLGPVAVLAGRAQMRKERGEDWIQK